MRSSRSLSRRLPPLVMGVAAIILMVAVLPSSLHVPTSGPNGQAEVAPVPGQGQNQSNLSQLGLADSGTTGTGGSGALVDGSQQPESLADLLDPLNPGQRVAQQANCFGRPARQTEDPLSPPCVAFWKGDNHGATYKGVTRSSIRVIVYDERVGGGNKGGENFTTDPIQPSDTPFRRTLKTLIRYFNKRFQTYGRSVEFVEYVKSGDQPANQATDAKSVAEQSPFATFSIMGGDVDRTPYLSGTASAGILSFNGIWSGRQKLRRSFITQHSPYVWSFMPDLETTEANFASYICRELVDGTAAHAGAGIVGQPRKVGLLYEDVAGNYDPISAAALRDSLQQTCNLDLSKTTVAMTATSASAAAPALAQLQAAGVTTILCQCPTTGAAAAADTLTPPYFPEWVVNSDNSASDPYNARQVNQDQWSHALGITWKWRVPAVAQAYWGRAYSEVNQDGEFDTWYGPSIYESLMQVFTAIQMAGPFLTPGAVQSGLESFSRTAVDAASPSGSYGPADHAFLKDELAEWWDPTGVAQGGNDPSAAGSANGCYRQVGSGFPRHRPGDWPQGDHAGDAGTCDAEFERLGNSGADQGGN